MEADLNDSEVDASRIWAHNENSNHYKDNRDHAWDYTHGFAYMLKSSTTTKVGAFGNTRYGELNYADLGDVIYVNWNGDISTYTDIDHAMVVTKISTTAATVGNRGISDLYIAAHSTDQGAYEYLATYLNPSYYPESRYATGIIDSGYYREPNT